MNNMVIRSVSGWRSVLAIAAVLVGVTSSAHGLAAEDSRAI